MRACFLAIVLAGTAGAQQSRAALTRGTFAIIGADVIPMTSDTFPDSLGKYEVRVLIANGITAARLMIGTSAQLALRKEIVAGRAVGP